ncbi:hypothetical protein [Ornithinimicrobium sufpigmenti]|uniref:hypothetical protein n=1 Tax=Ornithinimicrobium sufpigmenti TaxID=2508882 RepID=UPI0015E164C7|nr:MULTISPECIES: hypothetical protein [unclassified Ornithinimicrobium]
MEHLMNQLVGRSIAQERERALALQARQRRAEPADRRRQNPPRPHRGATPVVAHA